MPALDWEVVASDYSPFRGIVPQLKIVTYGDSTTRRNPGNFPQWHNWPEWDFRRLIGPYARVINTGDSGADLTQLISGFNVSVRVFRPRIVTLLAGLNTVRTQVTPDPVTVEAELTTLYNSCLALNAKVVPITISPWTDGTWDLTREGVRQSVNTWIMGGGGGLGLTGVNIEPYVADTTDPTHPVIAPAYSAGDGLHFNDIGALIVAREVFRQGFAGTRLGRL
jgi:hypothetical protein